MTEPAHENGARRECPYCSRVITLTSSGTLRAHYPFPGNEAAARPGGNCCGSGADPDAPVREPGPGQPVTHSHYHGHRPYGRSRRGFAHEHEHTHPDGETNHQLSEHEHYRDDPDGEIVRPRMSDPADKTGS